MKRNSRHLLKALLSVLALTMLFCMPASAASKKTVATIGKTSYTTMASAVKAVKNGQTIKLQKNVKIKGALNSNKKYTINLNGYTLTGTYAIKDTRVYSSGGKAVRVSSGNVTLKNGTVSGLYVNKGATLTLSNLSLNNPSYSSGYLYIKKGAKVKIKNITTGENYEQDEIYNYGSLTINDGTFGGYGEFINESSGNIKIQGGKFENYISNKGTMTISNGTFKNGIGNYGKMTISGGNFTGKNYGSLLYNGGSNDNYAQLTIKGGTFKASDYNCVVYNGTYSDLKITGGTFKATGNVENVDNKTTGTIFCYRNSKTTITGGTISNKHSNGIYVCSYADSFKCSGAKITVSSSKMEKICYQ